MIETGWLARNGDHWRIREEAGADSADPLPTNLRQMIGALLDRVDKDDLEILEAAGVLFPTVVVAAASESAAGVEAIEDACSRLVEHWGLLAPASEQAWPDGTRTSRYRFRHALFHTVLYDRVSPGRRRRLHQQVGESLEAAYAGRTAAIAGELAAHFERSGDDVRAVTHLLEAADGARMRLSRREMESYLRAALEKIPNLPAGIARDGQELRARLSLVILRSMSEGLDFDDSEDELAVIAQADAILEQVPDGPFLVPLLNGLWRLHMLRTDARRIRPLAERFLRVAEVTGELADRLEASGAMLCAQQWAGRMDGTLEGMERNWSIYRDSLPDHERSSPAVQTWWRSLGIRIAFPLAWRLVVDGHFDRAASAWAHARVTADVGHALPFNLAILLFGKAVTEEFTWDFAAARQTNQQALDIASEDGLVGVRNGLELQRLWIDMASNEPPLDATELLDRWQRFRRHVTPQPVTSLYFIQACARTGAIEAGLEEVAAQRRNGDLRDLHWHDSELFLAEAALLRVRRAPGDEQRAVRLLRDAVELSSHRGQRLCELRAALAWFRAAPDADASRQALESAVAALAQASPAPPILLEARRAVAAA